MALKVPKMDNTCGCDWCTTVTQICENKTLMLPAFIKFGQGKSQERSVIACMYSFQNDDASVVFPNGLKFDSLTSAGKYAHNIILKKKTSDGNNGWKRWRMRVGFEDGTIKPVNLKTLKDSNICFSGDHFNKRIVFKSNYCTCEDERIAQKTIIRSLNKDDTPNKKRKESTVECFNKRAKSEPIYVEEMDIDHIKDTVEEYIDLDHFSVDTQQFPGDERYNQIVYGRKYIPFSNISEDPTDSDVLICTMQHEFVNIEIPKSILLVLHNYKNCKELEKFRKNTY